MLALINDLSPVLYASLWPDQKAALFGSRQGHHLSIHTGYLGESMLYCLFKCVQHICWYVMSLMMCIPPDVCCLVAASLIICQTVHSKQWCRAAVYSSVHTLTVFFRWDWESSRSRESWYSCPKWGRGKVIHLSSILKKVRARHSCNLVTTKL